VVPIYEVGEFEGRHYFSMGYVEGQSLAAKVAQGPLPPREAAELFKAVAEAVQYAHQKGVIHRDLKPANILLDSSGRPRVTDFGLAKRVEGGSPVTTTGQILGTPSYMPPEQAAGGTIVPASDVYAMGAVLYVLLTGRPPFYAAEPLDTLAQVLNAEPVSPRQLNPDVPRDLETIVLKCLEKSPQRRYATAEELGQELDRYLAGRPIHARPVSQPERLWRWCRRNPSRAAAAGIALVSLLGLLTVGAWFQGRLGRALRQTEAAEQELQGSLVRQAAERLNSNLLQVTKTPELLATTPAQRTDWTQAQLAAWMRDALRKDSRIFGSCAAFEPGEFDPGQEDYAFYVSREANGLAAKHLTFPEYTPHYRKWEWYVAPKRMRRAMWSEPFFDKGGGNVPMVTYSVPLERQGQVVGVMTADVSVGYIEDWLEKLRLGRKGYAFVVSSVGTFISHPNPAYRVPEKVVETPTGHLGAEAPRPLEARRRPPKITEAPEFQTNEDLKVLVRQVLNPKSGRVAAVDPWTGRLSTFLFEPVPSADWTLVVVIETDEPANPGEP
jgi:hypothetical protein